MKATIYSKALASATLLLVWASMIPPSFAEEEAATTVAPEKKERVFNYNRRARIRSVDMGVDAPKDRYKVDRPSMDRLAEDSKEDSIFSTEKQFTQPQMNVPQQMPNRQKGLKEDENKNWLTPSRLSGDESGEGRSRSIFEKEYDERQEAESEENSVWEESDDEMSEAEREEERYSREDEEDEEDRFALRKNAIDDSSDSVKRLGLLEFKPALERNLYSDEGRTGEGRASESAEQEAERDAVNEKLSRMDGRRENAGEHLDENEGFSRTAKAMGLNDEDDLGSNRSAKMMSEITDKWLHGGASSASNVPKMEDMLNLPKGGGLNAQVSKVSPGAQMGAVGANRFNPQGVHSSRGMNLPSARLSPVAFKAPAFSPSISKPSGGAGSISRTPQGISGSGSSFSSSPRPAMNQGHQSARPAASSSSFGNPYGGGSSSGAVAPRRMKSEMGMGGFKVPKL